MPDRISHANKGSSNRTPYVATWMYDGGRARLCVCGCHDGYHNADGECLNNATCNCLGFNQDGDKTDPPNQEISGE